MTFNICLYHAATFCFRQVLTCSRAGKSEKHPVHRSLHSKAMKSALFLLAFLCSSRLIQAKIKPALPCNQDKCRPPNCRCSDDFKPPGKLPVNKTPQIILLTFDDDLSTINYKQYQEVFYNRTNPNGCPTIGTFFVSHNYTSYYLVEEMYSQGHEVADHSVTHQTPTTYWIDGSYGMWKNESTAQREILHRFVYSQQALNGAVI